MSFTFNLILALFLLAPGLGMFAGVYTGGRRPFRPAAAEPGSIHALAVVSIGALFCHAICAWLLVWMESYCGAWACFTVSYNPNPYEIILHLRESMAATRTDGTAIATVLSPAGVAWLFTSLLLIGFVGFLIGLGAVFVIGSTGFLRSRVYGWVDELLTGADTKAHVFTAFVLTDSEYDGKLLGYEGSLIDLRQSPSGEIRVVVLKDAEPFVVQMTDDSARRQKETVKDDAPKKTIGFLAIEGSNIKNIAFRSYLDPRRLSDKEYARFKASGDLDVKADAPELGAATSPKAPVPAGPKRPTTAKTARPKVER